MQQSVLEIRSEDSVEGSVSDKVEGSVGDTVVDSVGDTCFKSCDPMSEKSAFFLPCAPAPRQPRTRARHSEKLEKGDRISGLRERRRKRGV
eukprot:1117569-Rhodomonas_salina.1